MDVCLFQINVGGLSLDFFGLVDLALNEAKVVKNFTSLKDSRYSRYSSLERTQFPATSSSTHPQRQRPCPGLPRPSP